jgi:acyl carrier protein
LALGYWQDPELTARAFVPSQSDPEIRTFRTGDLGRRRSDGLIEFAGRKDQQIKLHGNRVEPDEVEGALKACSGVKDAAIVVRRNDDGSARSLVAYAELRPDADGLLPRHLQSMLAQRLPKYMLPALIFVVDKLPRLPSYKLDRIGLKEIDAARLRGSADELSHPMIAEVAQIFQRLVGVANATADDNLASLGGDSMLGVEIALELEKRFAVKIPPESFDPTRRISQWAEWIADQHARQPIPVGR